MFFWLKQDMDLLTHGVAYAVRRVNNGQEEKAVKKREIHVVWLISLIIKKMILFITISLIPTYLYALSARNIIIIY